LLLGRSLTLVAAEFQVSRSTLGRHSRLHVRERTARALERVSVEYSRRLRPSMNVIQGQVLQILAQARKDGNLPLALEAAQWYTAGTRSFSLVDGRDLIDRLIGLCSTAQGPLHVPANFTPSQVISLTRRIALRSRDQGGCLRPIA